MKANDVADALEDGGLQVVVEQGARHAAERGERGEVAPRGSSRASGRGEAGEERARPRQHHDEAGQGPSCRADGDRAEAGPVDLGLLARQRREAEERLAGAAGADRANEAAQRPDRARVPALLDHLEEPRRAQPRVLLERGADEVLVRIEQRDAGERRRW